jgi:hypothetical protein
MTRTTLMLLLALVTACDSAQPRPATAAGWVVQHDDKNVVPVDSRFQLQPDGSMEVAQGPNADAWSQLEAKGNYRLSVDVTHLDSGLHPHGAGLLFGGRERGTANEHYGYFLVRGDRCFLVKMRRGAETQILANWTEHTAIAAEDQKGITHNRLTVEVTVAEVRFLVNGTEVQRLPRQGFPSEGAIGYRLVHDLRVRFGKLELEPLP